MLFFKRQVTSEFESSHKSTRSNVNSNRSTKPLSLSPTWSSQCLLNPKTRPKSRRSNSHEGRRAFPPATLRKHIVNPTLCTSYRASRRVARFSERRGITFYIVNIEYIRTNIHGLINIDPSDPAIVPVYKSFYGPACILTCIRRIFHSFVWFILVGGGDSYLFCRCNVGKSTSAVRYSESSPPCPPLKFFSLLPYVNERFGFSSFEFSLPLSLSRRIWISSLVSG